jgi:hypothetical protein
MVEPYQSLRLFGRGKELIQILPHYNFRMPLLFR